MVGDDSAAGSPATQGPGARPGEPGQAQDGVVEVTRVARLTHAQYDNTVGALLGVTDRPGSTFAPDAQDGYAFDSSINLRVDGRLGPQYRAAAEELAEKVAAEPGFAARFVDCAPGSAGCAEAFVSEFGLRAFRRPLTDQERARFEALFTRGPELVASGDAFRDGVRLVVEAMLQSPQFLYRTELSTAASGDGLIALDAWEIASRLAYFLWNSMPDEPLLSAAAAGGLQSEEDVRAAAAQLIEDARAEAVITSFHAQALRFAKFKKIAPDAAFYPAASGDFAKKVDEAARLFVKDAIIDGGGGIAELLTAPFAYADSELAAVYGLSAGGSTFEKLTFEAGSRAGLLMQAGWLASNAYAIRTDPIHRGLFVQRDLLCQVIPDPPPGASMTPLPPTTEEIKTTRQQITLLTSQAGCAGCHEAINAPGFAFEAFDAIGQERSTENGAPVDTSGSITLDGSDVTFSGAYDLVHALATSEQVRACYVGKWFEYAYGRSRSEADQASIEALAREPLPALELALRVATSKGFRFRAPNAVE